MKRNVGRAVLVGILLLSPAQALAQPCAELYAAIKSEAMYCGFFCEQERVQPLQVAYEAQCIAPVVPFSVADMEPVPYHSLAWATSEPAIEPVEDATPEPSSPAASQIPGKQSMLIGEGADAD